MMGKGKTMDVGIILAGLGRGKHKGPMGSERPEPESDEGEDYAGVSDEDYATAAGEVRAALEGDDDGKLARSLKAFYDLCCSDESEPEIEED